MVTIDYGEKFKAIYYKIKENSFKTRIKKQVEKIIKNPDIGKPMKYARKGTRELYIKPFRLSYVYIKIDDKIVILDLYHKKKQ